MNTKAILNATLMEPKTSLLNPIHIDHKFILGQSTSSFILQTRYIWYSLKVKAEKVMVTVGLHAMFKLRWVPLKIHRLNACQERVYILKA